MYGKPIFFFQFFFFFSCVRKSEFCLLYKISLNRYKEGQGPCSCSCIVKYYIIYYISSEVFVKNFDIFPCATILEPGTGSLPGSSRLLIKHRVNHCNLSNSGQLLQIDFFPFFFFKSIMHPSSHTQAHARRAMDFLWEKRQRNSNLVGTTINIHSGEWVRRGERGG